MKPCGQGGSPGMLLPAARAWQRGCSSHRLLGKHAAHPLGLPRCFLGARPTGWAPARDRGAGGSGASWCRARSGRPPPPRSSGVRGLCLLLSLWLAARPWPAASLVGTVCTVHAEPSLSSRRINFFSNLARAGWGGGRVSSPCTRKQPRRIPALLFIKA